MPVTLIGEIVNSGDSSTGWTTGSISGDDDFVEGAGAIGVKASNTVVIMETTSLGAGAPYDFSSGGAEFGYHFIVWINTKTPIAATGGLRLSVVDSGGLRVQWHADPTVFYKGGFITKVMDLGRDSNTASPPLTNTGNPAQLTAITQMGVIFQTITSIMGSFNNVQVDQMTIGLGVRVDAGTVGTPNTFETVRIQDEDTSFWGWWSSTQGAFIGKGKMFIGPATGSAVSVFTDEAFSVIFADEKVAIGFYEFDIRGAGTDVSWTLASIASANPANARWGITVDSSANSFEDVNGVWTGADQLILSANSILTATTLINCTKLIQNSAELSGVTVLSANNSSGVSFIESDDPSLISDCSFSFSQGHAIEITTPGTYTFSGNLFSGYGANSTNTAAIYNNSGGAVTLNITGGGDTPTIRNGSGASTSVVNAVSISVTILDANTLTPISGARVYVEALSGGPATSGDVILSGVSDGSGIVENTGFAFLGNQPISGRARKSSSSPYYKTGSITGTITSSGLDVTVVLVVDE